VLKFTYDRPDVTVDEFRHRADDLSLLRGKIAHDGSLGRDTEALSNIY